jgi:hypothetical protein
MVLTYRETRNSTLNPEEHTLQPRKPSLEENV